MLEELHDYDVGQDFLEQFPLKKYGYVFKARLNAKNSWPRKVVCSVLGDRAKMFVSTTFSDQGKYLKFLEVSSILEECVMLHPEIFQLYEEERTAICHYIGDFLPPVLLTQKAYCAVDAVLGYLDLLDSLFPRREIFDVPRNLRAFFRMGDKFPQVDLLISKTKDVLPKLKERGICMRYGAGIEDPDIKNFRIVRDNGQFQALTTDYDCWSEKVNYCWATGYFYASLRWLAKVSPAASMACGEHILRTTNVDARKDEFMFWLGVLSGYCGYRRTMEKAIIENRMDKFQGEQKIMKQLDEKVSHLAHRLIETEEKYVRAHSSENIAQAYPDRFNGRKGK